MGTQKRVLAQELLFDAQLGEDSSHVVDVRQPALLVGSGERSGEGTAQAEGVTGGGPLASLTCTANAASGTAGARIPLSVAESACPSPSGPGPPRPVTGRAGSLRQW
ncbi:hypothetical protein GCM10010398_69730 [Streptomyces fimbriatus]